MQVRYSLGQYLAAAFILGLVLSLINLKYRNNSLELRLSKFGLSLDDSPATAEFGELKIICVVPGESGSKCAARALNEILQAMINESKYQLSICREVKRSGEGTRHQTGQASLTSDPADAPE